MIEIQPPNENKQEGFKIFLAGTIEMDTAERWQKKIIDSLADKDVIIFNPRRNDWDSSWKQEASDPNFAAQVEWELEHIEAANLVVFYFQPGSKSPISMLELGIVSHDSFVANKQVIVCCPEGFYRKGNIDIVSQYYDMTIVNNFEELIEKIKEEVNLFHNKKS